jgi:hypothetical protein
MIREVCEQALALMVCAALVWAIIVYGAVVFSIVS